MTSSSSSSNLEMNRSGMDHVARENQLKLVDARISTAERDLALICEDFAAYTRKTARLRDKGDLLARHIYDHATMENKTSKRAFTEAAELLSFIQDYRQTEVVRLETKVIEPLKSYGTHCKKAKDEVKQSLALHRKEKNNQKNLENVAGRGKGDINAVSSAEAELRRSAVSAAESSRTLTDTTERFEARRVHDLKHILREFINIEMIFHAKALEIYTAMYRTVDTIDEDLDMEEFRQTLRPMESIARADLSRAAADSRNASSNPAPAAATTNGHRPQEEEDDEEEDEFEEEDEEESEYEDSTEALSR